VIPEVSGSSDPTPHGASVENKGVSAIRPNGDRPVEALCSVFLGFQSRSISAFFFRFYCSVGRGLQAFAKYQEPNTKGPLANCQLLAA
jgi:hypothetical protein